MADILAHPSTLTFGQRVRIVSDIGVMTGVLTSVVGMNGDRTAPVEVEMEDGGAVVWIGPARHLRAVT